MKIPYYKGKTIWITGASSGIGRALAVSISRHRCHLILFGRSVDRLQETQRLLHKECQSTIVTLDMLDDHAIEPVCQCTMDDHGPVDILINNAGVSQRSIALNTTMEVYKKLMQVNYLSVVHMTKCVLPSMVNRGSGQIVTITSVNGKLGSYMKSGYAASKHALHGFFDSLRAEISDSGVAITLVTPGYIHTDISVNALTCDGTAQGTMDANSANGIPVKVFSEKAIRLIAKRKQEFAVAKGVSNWALYLKRFAPGLLRKLAARRKEA